MGSLDVARQAITASHSFDQGAGLTSISFLVFVSVYSRLRNVISPGK
jgi:hypothetical protein